MSKKILIFAGNSDFYFERTKELLKEFDVKHYTEFIEKIDFEKERNTKNIEEFVTFKAQKVFDKLEKKYNVFSEETIFEVADLKKYKNVEELIKTLENEKIDAKLAYFISSVCFYDYKKSKVLIFDAAINGYVTKKKIREGILPNKFDNIFISKDYQNCLYSFDKAIKKLKEKIF